MVTFPLMFQHTTTCLNWTDNLWHNRTDFPLLYIPCTEGNTIIFFYLTNRTTYCISPTAKQYKLNPETFTNQLLGNLKSSFTQTTFAHQKLILKFLSRYCFWFRLLLHRIRVSSEKCVSRLICYSSSINYDDLYGAISFG